MKEKRYTVIIDQDKDGITWRQIKTSEGFKTTYHQDNYDYYLMRINLLNARGYTKDKTITKTLRMMNLFKIFSFSVLFLLSFCAKSQTYLKKIPIETDDPFVVYTWAFDENINAWRWASVFETSIEHENGWIYNREVNIKVDKYDILHALFIRGFDDCSDTTRVTIYGSFDKEVVKDKPEFRKQILLNGKHQEFGTEIKRP